MEKVKSFTKKNIIVFVLIFLCLGFGLGNKSFLSAQNLVNLTTQMAINAMLSAGLTYVIILGGIDISVGSVAALAGVCGALVARENPDASIFVASLIWIGAALVVGALCGAFNGLMIAYFKVVPMIATLAMLNMARGLCFVLSGGSSVSGVKSNYSFLGAARLLQTADKPTGWIPIITIFVIVAVFIVHILLSMSGINTAKITFLSHVICGIMAAMGGVLNASKLQNGQPGACDAYEMYAIAATVLGGTSLSGGSGSVGRAMIGVAVIAVINNGMNLLHIDSYWQKVVIGMIILLAVILDMAQKKQKA